MATYLQGVTDFIPQVQPFQPDLNFYGNLLETKQNQYDQNWKSLNNMYGQYFYADLTRPSNVEKKEEYLKDIEFNLKRVSALDLSLEQNVNQATQVFRPFYEDKFLIKDMVWTKDDISKVNRAEALRNSDDPDIRKQYWSTGLRGMQYRRERFKNSSDEESLEIGNNYYIPYINAADEAMKIAKDADLNITAPEFSPDGKWLIHKTNGELIEKPLLHLFESILGSDPGIQDVYREQAYVDRWDDAHANAAQFDGGIAEAEMDYLQRMFKSLKDLNTQQMENLDEDLTVTDNKIKHTEEVINNEGLTQNRKNYLEKLFGQKQITQKVQGQSEYLQKLFNSGSGTGSTTTGFENPYGDLKSLRQKVDAGRASYLFRKDMGEAAWINSHRDAKIKMEANPYEIQRIKQAGANARLEKKLKQDEQKRILEEWKFKHKHGHADFKVRADGSVEFFDIINEPEREVITDPGATQVETDPIEELKKGRNQAANKIANNLSSLGDEIQNYVTGIDMLSILNPHINSYGDAVTIFNGYGFTNERGGIFKKNWGDPYKTSQALGLNQSAAGFSGSGQPISGFGKSRLGLGLGNMTTQSEMGLPDLNYRPTLQHVDYFNFDDYVKAWTGREVPIDQFNETTIRLSTFFNENPGLLPENKADLWRKFQTEIQDQADNYNHFNEAIEELSNQVLTLATTEPNFYQDDYDGLVALIDPETGATIDNYDQFVKAYAKDSDLNVHEPGGDKVIQYMYGKGNKKYTVVNNDNVKAHQRTIGTAILEGQSFHPLYHHDRKSWNHMMESNQKLVGTSTKGPTINKDEIAGHQFYQVVSGVDIINDLEKEATTGRLWGNTPIGKADFKFTGSNTGGQTIQKNGRKSLEKVILPEKTYLVHNTSASGWTEGSFDVTEITAANKSRLKDEIGLNILRNKGMTRGYNIDITGEDYHDKFEKAKSNYNALSQKVKGVKMPDVMNMTAGGWSMHSDLFTITIDPKRQGPNFRGKDYFLKSISQFNNFPMGDPRDGYSGIIAAGVNQEDAEEALKGGFDGKEIHARFQNYIVNNTDAIFSMSAGDIALNDRDQNALIIRPDNEFIDSITHSYDSDGDIKQVKLITQEQAKRMLTSGYALIAPDNIFTTDLHQEATIDPFSSNMNMLKDGETWKWKGSEHLIPSESGIEYEFQVMKGNPNGVNAYKIMYNMPMFDDERGIYIPYQLEDNTNNLDVTMRNLMIDVLNAQAKDNSRLEAEYNRNH